VKKHRVSWSVAGRVFWAQFWRMWLAALALTVSANLLEAFSPELFGRLAAVFWPALGIALIVYWLWAVRESLTNDYKSFELKINRREGKVS
jgi:hypothetical protein